MREAFVQLQELLASLRGSTEVLFLVKSVKEKVKINYASLEVVKAYDDWGSEDMTAVTNAITAGKAFTG